MASRRHRLAQRRKSVGFSQEQLAHRLRIERSTVVRWESGDTEPQPWMRPKIAHTLKISPEQLDDLLADADRDGPHPSAPAAPPQSPTGPASSRLAPLTTPEIDDMNRRELLRLFSMTGTLLAMPGIDVTLDSGTAAAQPARATAAALEEHTELNRLLWRVFALSASKAETMPAVRNQLGTLSACLQQPHGDSAHRTLCTLIADLFQLAGEIFFDGNHYTEAAHCYTLAASAAREATAFDLWACAMTRHAFIAVYERQFDRAAPMLELASALARRGDSALSTRHWVSVVQAETFAGLCDLDACQRALDDAEEVRQMDGPVQNGGWLRFDGSRLDEERGTCYLTLGRPDLAETALTTALNRDLTPRRRATVLTELAAIGAHRRDTDQVLTYAEAALTQARQTGSGVISRKLRELQSHLAPLLTDARVRQLNTEIGIVTEPLTIG